MAWEPGRNDPETDRMKEFAGTTGTPVPAAPPPYIPWTPIVPAWDPVPAYPHKPEIPTQRDDETRKDFLKRLDRSISTRSSEEAMDAKRWRIAKCLAAYGYDDVDEEIVEALLRAMQ